MVLELGKIHVLRSIMLMLPPPLSCLSSHEQKKIGELEEQIKAVQSRVLAQKQKMGGVNASKENDALIGRQLRTLENRLDKALIKFNQSLAEVGEGRINMSSRGRGVEAGGHGVVGGVQEGGSRSLHRL
jgi:hypothetical protein